MPPVGAVIGGIGSIIGGAAAGAAGLAAGAASVIGSAASGILGGAAGLAGGAASAVGGTISALTGGAAAPAAGTVGAQMAAIAQPAYYETAALGVPAATTGVSSLATLTSAVGAGVGIYGQLADIEIAKGMTEAQKIAAQKGLMEAEALKLYAEGKTPPPPAPTLSSQPVYVTPAAPAAPNYLLYAGLAILAIFLFRKK